MNTVKMKLALFALCGLLIAPGTAAAYEVTDSSAQRLSDDTILFSVTYQFGFLNREMRMPIQAAYGDDTHSNRVSYTINSGSETLENVVAPAVVLTSDEDVTIEDGQYFLPEGRNAQFTLYGFLRLAEDTPTNALNLRITNLPYTMIDGSEEAIGVVLPDELPEYRTPSLTLTDGLTITSSPVTIEVSD